MKQSNTRSGARDLPSRWPTRAASGQLWLVTVSVMFATALPFTLLLHRYPLFGALSVFANDTFYYLTIAREAIVTGKPSFDGTYRTNGFHPVWEWLLIGLAHTGWLRIDQPQSAIVRTAYLNLCVLTLATGFLANVLMRALGRGWLVFVTLCPGLLWFLQAPVNPRWVAGWSNLNGMESSIELFFFGAALAFLPLSLTDSQSVDRSTTATSWRTIAASGCFGLMVLSRLDDVFFLFPLSLLLLKHRGRPANQRARLLSLCLPFLLLSIYVAYNKGTLGIFLPSSGVAKAGFAGSMNLQAVLHMVLPNFSGAPPRGTGAPFDVFGETYGRVFGMLAPAIVCAVFLLRLRVSGTLIEALCFGVLLKSAYNFFFVDLFYQGSWYYTVNICVANICLAIAVHRSLTQAGHSDGKANLSGAVGALLAAGIFVAVCANVFLNSTFMAHAAAGQLALLGDAEEIRRMLSTAGSDRFVEYDDGMLSFATGAHAMAGLGLALDPEANRARQNGELFQLELSRGYALALVTQPYKALIDLAMARVAGGKHDGQFGLQPVEFDRYVFVPEQTTRDGLVTLYRLKGR